MPVRKIILVFCLTLVLTGCGTLPASGPYSSKLKKGDKVSIKVSSQEEGNGLRYAVAEIDKNLIDYLSAQIAENKKRNYNWPRNTEADEITVNVGDTIQVSVFESQAGGLFIPVDSGTRPGNFVSLPAQTIDYTGYITVPYAGKVKAAGKTTEQISDIIVERLQNKAIEPQVVVSFSGRNGAEVSVIGDVNNSQRLSLGFNKYKILDAIASAGGPTSPGHETKVSLQRNHKEYTIPFDALVQDADKNIYAAINDIIYLYKEPQTFTAYGAVESQGNIPFGKRKLLLSEALGLTRGLRDTQADPAEVYIYRQEKYPYFKDGAQSYVGKSAGIKQANLLGKPAVVKLGAHKGFVSRKGKALPPRVGGEPVVVETDVEAIRKLDLFGTPKSKIVSKDYMTSDGRRVTDNGDVSLIFKLDMRNPSSFFLAQNFVMEDQDVVYVANAKSVEFRKFLNILSASATTTTNTDIAGDRF